MTEEKKCNCNQTPKKNAGRSTSREYINLAVKGDRVGALKNIMTSLGNLNPASKFI